VLDEEHVDVRQRQPDAAPSGLPVGGERGASGGGDGCWLAVECQQQLELLDRIVGPVEQDDRGTRVRVPAGMPRPTRG
jgi:hypothetical protein